MLIAWVRPCPPPQPPLFPSECRPNFRCHLTRHWHVAGPPQRDARPRPARHAERVLLHGGDHRLRHRGAVGASRGHLQVGYAPLNLQVGAKAVATFGQFRCPQTLDRVQKKIKEKRPRSPQPERHPRLSSYTRIFPRDCERLKCFAYLRVPVLSHVRATLVSVQGDDRKWYRADGGGLHVGRVGAGALRRGGSRPGASEGDEGGCWH